MKMYHEQSYPFTITVLITFPDGGTHWDCVKGLNRGHALYLARKNWPNANSIQWLKDGEPESSEEAMLLCVFNHYVNPQIYV